MTTHHQTCKASAVGHCTASKVTAVQPAEEVFMEAVPWVLREPTFKKRKRWAVQRFFQEIIYAIFYSRDGCVMALQQHFFHLLMISLITSCSVCEQQITCGCRFTLDLVDLCLWGISVRSILSHRLFGVKGSAVSRTHHPLQHL